MPLAEARATSLGRVDDRARGLCRFECRQRLADDPHLLGGVVGLAQRVPEGELDGQRPRHADLFCPEGHRRYQDRGQAGCLQRPRQHGHVDRAVRSGRDEQDALYPFSLEFLGYLGAVGLSPGDRVRRKALVAHEGIGLFRQVTEAPLGDQLLETVDGQ